MSISLSSAGGTPVRVAGASFIARGDDEILDALRRGREFEAREIKFVISLLQPGQTFWDIGANFGLYTVLAARKVGPAGRVIAFEPDPGNLEMLRANIRQNDLNCVSVVPRAVSDREGLAEFCCCSQGAYSGLKVCQVPGTLERITVEITALDAVFQELGRPAADLVKIDVEGAERLVFEGGVQFLGAAPRPVVICEFSDRRSAAFGARCCDLYAWLADRGYDWYELTPEACLRRAPARDHYDYENLVACPEEKTHCIQHWIQ